MNDRPDNPYSAPSASGINEPTAALPSALFYKRNELREMAWKILAIVLCLKLADYVAMIGRYSETYAGMAWSIIPMGTTLWFIGYAYFQSRRYHAMVDSPENDNEITIGIVLLMQRVLFSVLGVYLIVTEASDFILALLHAYSAIGGLYFPATFVRDAGSEIAFLAGFFLFFGANSLSRSWTRFRSFGAR